jgi:protein-L-isoaspartate O-methyltransferase
VVFIEGGVEEVAPALVAQLAPTGRMVMIRNPPSGRAVGQAVLGRRVADDMSFAPMFDANAPTLPMFRHVAGFVF